MTVIPDLLLRNTAVSLVEVNLLDYLASPASIMSQATIVAPEVLNEGESGKALERMWCTQVVQDRCIWCESVECKKEDGGRGV